MATLDLSFKKQIRIEPRRFKLSQMMEERIVMTIIDCLDGDERNVLEYRVGFGLPEALTYEKIGELLGVTAQRISQIEEEALAKIIKNCRHTRFERMRPEFQTKVGTLNLPARAHNCLVMSGILYVEQLCLYTALDLKHVAGIGHRSMKHIKEALAKIGHELPPTPGKRGNTGKFKTKRK